MRDRSGHDMNYLGRIGLLGLTGEADGPPVQAGGPDRRPRRRRADGGVRDPGRAARARPLRRGPVRRRLDGRRRALVAGDGRRPVPLRRRRCRAAARSCSPAASSATGPTRCADGYVTLGALEPKFWRNWCAGVGREDLIEHQFEAPGSDAHREVEAVFAARTRAEWEAFAAEHDCCLEPVLDLDEALDGELVRRARWSSSSTSRAPSSRCGCSASRSSSRARPATPTGCRAPALGEHTDDGAARARATATRRSPR